MGKMRKRGLQLPENGIICIVDNYLAEVNIGNLRPEIMVAELLLLSAGEVDEIRIWQPSSPEKVILQKVNFDGRGVATRTTGALVLSLSKRELDHWLHYFLRFYRDGIPEVDHLDLEVLDDRGSVAYSVTVKVDIESIAL